MILRAKFLRAALNRRARIIGVVCIRDTEINQNATRYAIEQLRVLGKRKPVTIVRSATPISKERAHIETIASTVIMDNPLASREDLLLELKIMTRQARMWEDNFNRLKDLSEKRLRSLEAQVQDCGECQGRIVSD